MKVVLYRKNKYYKAYITDYKSNIEFTHTSAYHEATIFDTVTQKNEIDYLKNNFGFDYKASKFNEQDFMVSKNMNRVYI